MAFNKAFVFWLCLIFAVYLALVMVVAVRRFFLGIPVAPREFVTVSDGAANVFHGTALGSLLGLLQIAASFVSATFALAAGYLVLALLAPLGIELVSPYGILFLVIAALSLGIVARSVWLSLGCWGVELDRKSRTVKTWWGLVRPWRQRSLPLDEFRAVAVRPGKKKSFRITLEGRGRPVLIDRSECKDRDQAQAVAKQIADAVGLSVQDCTG